MSPRTNEVIDGRLVRPELKQTPAIWRWSPHKEGITNMGASYSWEPGDMTLYKMTVMRHGYGSNVLVMIKELHVLVGRYEPLTQHLFKIRFKGLPSLDNLPLLYQYLRALHYTDDIPLVVEDISALVEKLRSWQYRAFWPVDQG